MNPVIQFISEVSRLAASFGTQLKIRGFKSGGITGHVPVKNSSDPFDWSWGFPQWTHLGTCPGLTFNLVPDSNEFAIGETKWSIAEGCLAYGIEGGDIAIGKEVFDWFTNESGGTLVDGDIVSVVGSAGGRRSVALTDATDTESSYNVVGMVTHLAVEHAKVRVTLIGKVHGLNTFGMTAGAVYVDPANPGKWTQTRPDAPDNVVEIGHVETISASEGVVAVRTFIGYRLQDLNDVNGTPLTMSGQILVWDNAAKVWDATKNVNSFAVVDGANEFTETCTFLSDIGFNGLVGFNADTTFAFTPESLAEFLTEVGLGPADDVAFKTVTLSVVTVENLPAGTVGMQILVSDADTPVVGSVVVSGVGADKLVQCIHNGTDWIVTAILT